MKKLTFLIAFVFVGLITQGQSTLKKGLYIGPAEESGSNIILLDSATYEGGLLKFYNGGSSLTVSGSMTYPGAGIAVSNGLSWGASITDNSAHWNTAYGWGDPSLTYVPLTRTVNGHALSGNISVTATDIGLGNVTNESKATMFSSPTFTGTVSGVTATMVGLGNVTNESKATMFTNPIFTGTNVRFGSPVTDTLATRAYARLYGGSGGGVWGLITGTIGDQTDLQNSLSLKVNIADSTGVSSGNYVTHTQFYDTISGSTVFNKLADTVPKFVFGYGVGIATDTLSCVVNADIGSFFNTDTLMVTKFKGVVKTGIGTPTVGVRFYYDVNLWDATPTAICAETNITSTTSGTEITSFTSQKIPPGVWVWGEIETVSTGNKPVALRITMLTYTK